MTDLGQGATPKQASVPHYQTTLAQIRLEIDLFHASSGVIELKCYYYPEQNYTNAFLLVVNLGVPEMAWVDWDALAQLAFKESKTAKKQQHKYKDFSTTGGQGTTHIGLVSGVAKPSQKPGTKKVCIVEAMLALSEYTKNVEYKWLPMGMHPFNCDVPDDPWNIFGLTNLENRCGYNVDELNSSMLQYECVPTFPKIAVLKGTRFRCSLIAYSRHSMCG
jgi:hypothetical protein